MEERKMPILLCQLTGRKSTVELKGSDTVADVKLKIREQEGIACGRQRLLFDRKQLEYGRTLADYNVRWGSTLHLVLKPRDGMMIRVKAIDNKEIVLEVEPTDVVESILERIAERTGMRPCELNLLFGDRVLCKGYSVKGCGFCDGACLQSALNSPCDCWRSNGDEWGSELDAFLVNLLIESGFHKNRRKKIGKWLGINTSLNHKFRNQFPEGNRSIFRIKYYFRLLKKRYYLLKQISKFPGMRWDEVQNMVHGQPEDWDRCMKEIKAAHIWKGRPFPHYATLHQLFEGHGTTIREQPQDSKSPPALGSVLENKSQENVTRNTRVLPASNTPSQTIYQRKSQGGIVEIHDDSISKHIDPSTVTVPQNNPQDDMLRNTNIPNQTCKRRKTLDEIVEKEHVAPRSVPIPQNKSQEDAQGNMKVLLTSNTSDQNVKRKSQDERVELCNDPIYKCIDILHNFKDKYSVAARVKVIDLFASNPANCVVFLAMDEEEREFWVTMKGNS